MDTTMLKPGSAQALQQLIRRMFLEVNTAIPGEVVSFNETKQTATVKPCIRGTVITNKGETEYTDQPEIIEVPVIFPYSTSTGFAITYPVASGDQCLLLFSQRSFDNWLKNGSVQNPSENGEPRSHQYSDAIAIVGMIPNGNTIENFQTSGIEIRDKSRSTVVSLTEGTIQIQSGITFLQINSTGTINVVSGVKVDITTPEAIVHGDLKVDGTYYISDGGGYKEGKSGNYDSLTFTKGLCTKV